MTLFPSYDALHGVFHPHVPMGRFHSAASPYQLSFRTPKPTPLQARSDLYPAWSVIDDAKDKANKLSAEATKEFEKASAKAQAKTGKIVMYSPEFYAACTFGGLLACVCPTWQPLKSHPIILIMDANWLLGPHPYGCHPLGPCQMPSPGRSEDVYWQFPSLGEDRPC